MADVCLSPSYLKGGRNDKRLMLSNPKSYCKTKEKTISGKGFFKALKAADIRNVVDCVVF